MKSIEELTSLFDAQPTSVQGRWTVFSLLPDRVYLSRDESGRYALFISGRRESFGSLPRLRGIQHSDQVIPVPGGMPISALRILSPNSANGNRILVHIAYEIQESLQSDLRQSNSDLLSAVSWILELLAVEDGMMSDDFQKGLLGELVLLRKLIGLARSLGLSANEALLRWHGFQRAKRDFSAEGIAIEVKTTSQPTRVHYVGSLDQLDPQGDEEVFVYSMGTRMDASAPRKLPAYVQDVRSLLVGSDGRSDPTLVSRFEDQLRDYGYDVSQAGLYEASRGFLAFHLPPKLFREKSLDRLRLDSFKENTLPSMVSQVMYDLDIHAAELSPSEEGAVFERLLRSPPT